MKKRNIKFFLLMAMKDIKKKNHYIKPIFKHHFPSK